MMATGSDVELIDRPDGNQFVARIWRTTQKDEITTQKANKELISTTQKGEATTQKPLNATQKKILAYLHNYPKATRKKMAEALGDITEDGVKFNIGLMQQYGALKRKGSRKNGEWKDWWEFPGGKMEAGETPEEALKREIREELSTEISVDEFLCTVEYDYPQFHLTMHCYLCSLLTEALHLNEHEAAKWLTKDELDSVKWLPADLLVIDALNGTKK